MTIEEYSALMGYAKNCPMEEYETADFIYMMAAEMTKQEFCKEYKDVGCSPLVLTLADEVHKRIILFQNEETQKCRAAHDLLREADEIRQGGMEASADAIDKIAATLIGQKDCIKRKLAYGFTLSGKDNEYITDNLR